MDLDIDDLERRYIELSRECHPDHHGSAAADQQIAVLERSARINDAYRQLRDPWRRAAKILELREPGVLNRNKQLCPIFLTEAMELSEAVSEAKSATASALRSRLEALVKRDLELVSREIEEEEWNEAATVLHQSRYHAKH